MQTKRFNLSIAFTYDEDYRKTNIKLDREGLRTPLEFKAESGGDSFSELGSMVWDWGVALSASQCPKCKNLVPTLDQLFTVCPDCKTEVAND